MDSLGRLARELSLPERTLRRAAGEGLLHGERVSARRFHTTLPEEMYLRTHWPVLAALRGALRSEPNVRLAVLFGSLAKGWDHRGSDIDLMVVLEDRAVGRLADLAGRLSSRMRRDVQLVRLNDAEGSPMLMRDILEHGRVLVDREERWQALRSDVQRWRRLAGREEHWGFQAMDDLLVDEELR